MANKSVLELAVETGKWDAGLKKAKSALDKFTDASGGLQKALDADSDKMSKFVQMMGKADSTAKTGKGQMNDYKQAIEQLTMQFNRMTDAQKKTVGQEYLKAIDQMKQKYRGVADEVQKLNQSLSGSGSSSSGGGGLFGGGKMAGMLQVFGGNLMTKAAGMAASFAAEMGEMVQQGVELARQGEGIRNAFERLGRGDILDGLREATHGTVTDLELMKAAVKFNDFNLPLEELGTMLAFAQQKAKDTGQSVDYMVDSIVTGLGRKSLMILDNLGLSANEIKEKMKDTGDMTKAVGEIIRQQMANAGDYVETAADRAAKADVDLKNAMEELGRTLLPLQEQGVSMWTSLKIGAIELLNEGLKPLVPAVVELKDSMSDMFDTVAKSDAFSGLVSWMQKSFDWAVRLIPVVNVLHDVMSRMGNKGLAGGASIGGALGNFMSYDAGQLPEVVVKAPRIRGGGGGRTSRSGGRSSVTTPKVEEILPAGSVAALNKELSELRKKQDLATDTEGWLAQQRVIDSITTKIKILKGQLPDPSNVQQGGGASISGLLNGNTPNIPDKINIDTGHIDKLLEKEEQMKKAAQMAAQAVSNIGDAFANIEDPSAKAAGTVMQAIASIALGFGQAVAQASSMGPWGWLAYVAAGTAALATTISTVHSLTGFENGGEIKGNSYSGDNTPIMANAGEIVLTRAMAGNIATQLQGSGSNVHVTGELRGESIYLAVNRSLKRRGKGELVTWK